MVYIKHNSNQNLGKPNFYRHINYCHKSYIKITIFLGYPKYLKTIS